MRIGYACINTKLAEEKVQVNRSMVRKTFLEKGLSYASELALRNVTDLERIIDWNIAHRMSLYRLSSDMFPWMSEYELTALPDYLLIKKRLNDIGLKVREHRLRLTFHPGPFNVLASPDPGVVVKTIKELRQHGEIMDLLELPRSPFSKINVHVGGAYGDRGAALRRFISNVSMLPPEAASRLTVENDDKANMFSVTDLLAVHEATGIPIVFDYHHHTFRTGDLTHEEAMMLAFDTWPKNITPIVHVSSSRKKYEDPAASDTSHADFVYEPINRYGMDVDIMVEAKAKEQAVIRLMQKRNGVALPKIVQELL
ncbi:MAG TPA: UV DNA damage repair endonuclease UvsE [Chryseosolibacter sp.]|nr:UV DNA damage repair endonuclease UvsE [Chryseosolibacter sp.]